MVWAISITKYRRALLGALLPMLLNCTLGFSQEGKRLLKIYPTVGVTWRSTAMNFFNFKAVIPSDPTNPYHSEKNVQGLSLNLGLQLQINNVGFEYVPNFRYDVVHYVFGSNNQYAKDFLIDHNLNFFVKRKLSYGVGISIVNDNKVYSFVNPVLRYHSIEFKTYNVFVTVPIKKVLSLEIKALYVPKGFPENPTEKYIMYSLRVYYKFKFLNKSRD